MRRDLVTSLLACVVSFVACAVLYPAAVWGLAQLAFPRQAEGSLIVARDGTVVGSELIAQPFAADRYFHPRPSAADYKADAASGSNLGPTNLALRKAMQERADALGATDANPAPIDLSTASGSGLDPHISPEAAEFQTSRVAKARGIAMETVRALIGSHIERSGAILGAPPRVNVLELNRALDAEHAGPPQ